jgi:hypothetical protein
VSDSYDPIIDKLDYVITNLLDLDTNQQKTNELLGQLLEEIRNLTKALQPAPLPPIPYSPQPSGYRCMFCGGWISTPAPHNCRVLGGGIS